MAKRTKTPRQEVTEEPEVVALADPKTAHSDWLRKRRGFLVSTYGERKGNEYADEEEKVGKPLYPK